MQNEPIENAARRKRRENELGPDAVCCLCGEVDPAALKKGARRLWEKHHVAGRQHDGGLTLILCRNCHAKQEEACCSVGADKTATLSFLERLAYMLRGVGAFLKELGERMLEWALKLTHLISALNARWPNWREEVS